MNGVAVLPATEGSRLSGTPSGAVAGSLASLIKGFAAALISLQLWGCSSTPKVAAPRPAPRQFTQSHLLRDALSLQGVPYVWGGTSPVQGFDCSGYVQYVFRRHGVELPRTARQMAAAVLKVPKGARAPGDLVFFQTTREPYSHVGIYLGNDSFVHASKGRGKGVQVSNLRASFWRRHWQAVGRPRSHRSARHVVAQSKAQED